MRRLLALLGLLVPCLTQAANVAYQINTGNVFPTNLNKLRASNIVAATTLGVGTNNPTERFVLHGGNFLMGPNSELIFRDPVLGSHIRSAFMENGHLYLGNPTNLFTLHLTARDLADPESFASTLTTYGHAFSPDVAGVRLGHGVPFGSLRLRGRTGTIYSPLEVTSTNGADTFFVIRTNGNVGIGTANARLDLTTDFGIIGASGVSIYFTNLLNARQWLKYDAVNDSLIPWGSAAGRIAWYASSDGSFSSIIPGAVGQVLVQTASGYSFTNVSGGVVSIPGVWGQGFYNSNGVLQAAPFYTTNNNVGIGTNNPSEALHVHSNILANGTKIVLSHTNNDGSVPHFRVEAYSGGFVTSRWTHSAIESLAPGQAFQIGTPAGAWTFDGSSAALTPPDITTDFGSTANPVSNILSSHLYANKSLTVTAAPAPATGNVGGEQQIVTTNITSGTKVMVASNLYPDRVYLVEVYTAGGDGTSSLILSNALGGLFDLGSGIDTNGLTRIFITKRTGQTATNVDVVKAEVFVYEFAISDETTAITTGTAKLTWRAPHAMTLRGVRGSLSTASSSGNPAFDINEGGSTIFSTTLTIDANEKTSKTAATSAVFSDTAIADDAEITFDIDTAGTGAKGAKIKLYYTK